MRLHPLLRDVQEPYRYEREVEEFLRWSPHVRDPSYRREPRLNSAQLLEVQKAVAGRTEVHPDRAPRAARPAEPAPMTRRAARRRPSPKRSAAAPADGAAVERYDDLTAAEVLPLLGSLERDDLVELRAHEQRSRGRTTVLSAIDRALARASAGT